MLTELHIRDFALIDDLRLELGAGFNVLTGETGAGKSIIVDAMSAALGERTGSDVVKTGAQRSLVEAVFDVSDAPAAAGAAADLGYEPEDGLLILSREIAGGGKSRCGINGRPATASVVREITARLIDIHGQHEHQSLLTVVLHIDTFDAWCGDRVMTLRDEALGIHGELMSLSRERDRLQTDERERARLLDLYGFQIEEVKSAELEPAEEEELAQERNRLANAEKLYEAASEIHQALAADGGAAERLSAAALSAERIAQVDPSMAGLVETLNTALFAAQDAQLSAGDYMDEIEANPQRLEQIEERLDLIRSLKRKYGDTVQEILVYADGLAEKVNDLAHADERSHELDARIHDLKARLESISGELTVLRKEAAPKFAEVVERELADLAMDRCRFEIAIEPTEPGPKGADMVEFLISPNPGEPVKPLAKIASGGEMSRIMLALKTVTTSTEIPTLVFDEIDAGIGGRTAQVLGEKLASLAGKLQVTCVTHLPMVASKATRHFAIEKSVENGRSVVRVKTLEGEERVAELARMLGGEETSGTAAMHAREMLSLANRRTG